MLKIFFQKKWLNLSFILILLLLLIFLTWYTVKVKNVNDYKSQLSLELSNEKYKEAVSTIHNILNLVSSDKDKCKYYFMLGDIYFYSLKKYQKGIDSYESAEKYATNDLSRKKILRSLSEIYETIGDYEKAIFYLKKCSELTKDKDEKIKLSFKILDLYKNEKKFEKALIGYKRLLKENPPPELKCRILFNIGIIYYLSKNFSSSIEFLNKAISNCGKNYPDVTNRAKLILMDCYEFIEDYDKAMLTLNSIPDKYIGKDMRERKIKELKKMKNGIKF